MNFFLSLFGLFIKWPKVAESRFSSDERNGNECSFVCALVAINHNNLFIDGSTDIMDEPTTHITHLTSEYAHVFIPMAVQIFSSCLHLEIRTTQPIWLTPAL